MEEKEFRRHLDLFPVVRSRNYRADSEKASTVLSSKNVASSSADWQNAWNIVDKDNDAEEPINGERFWQKLRVAAESKVGSTKADAFYKAFKRVHGELLERLSLDDARRFLGAVEN